MIGKVRSLEKHEITRACEVAEPVGCIVHRFERGQLLGARCAQTPSRAVWSRWRCS